MTARPLHRLAAAAALGLLLGGCTGTLYDAAGVPALDVNGCDVATQHVCPGADLTCRDDANPDFCGQSCRVCPPAPPGGARACVSQAGGWDCGFTCTAPLRACAARGECLAVGPTACGAGCTDCTLTAPAGAVATCSPAGECGYACPEGKLPCATGCCAPAAVAAGGDTTCAITDGGGARPGTLGLACWGRNDAGQLGRAGAASSEAPAPVPTMEGGVSMVAVGRQHACAVKAGVAWCWGTDLHGELGNDAALASSTSPVSTGLGGVQQLVAGHHHTCALLATGTVRCWGANDAGQLGLGAAGQPVPTPAAPVVGLAGVTMLAAGGDTTCALAAGAVRCWGANGAGQAGKGSTSAAEATPVTVALPGRTATTLGMGWAHACAGVTGVAAPGSDGLYCWGANESAQLGGGAESAAPQLTPALAGRIDNGTTVFLVAGGGAFTCGAKASNELVCNGRNDLFQSGVDAPSALEKGRTAVALGGALVQAASGGDHTCVLAEEVAGPVVRCWGSNAAGQLGRDAGTPKWATPRPVPGPP